MATLADGPSTVVMDLRHLRQILAIRDHGSFAKAAEALNLAQPALSKSMAKVEDELRLTIFTRTSTGSELTAMGEMIAERAERVMAATQHLVRDAALVAGGDAGVVRLGVGTLLRDTLAPRLLLKIVEAHPRLRLEVEFGAAYRLLPLVHSRELDLVLCADTMASALAYVETMRDEVIWLAAPTHPLVSEGRISVDRLAEFPCVGGNVPNFTPSTIAQRSGTAHTLDAYTSNDLEALVPLVSAGHATLAAPAFFARSALRTRELVRLDLDWPGRSMSFGCFTTHAASSSPILARITRYAIELAAEMQQERLDLGG